MNAWKNYGFPRIVLIKEYLPIPNTSEEYHFPDNYYSYLELSKNAPHSKPTVSFVNDAFEQQWFFLLDLKCGNGALCKYRIGSPLVSNSMDNRRQRIQIAIMVL